jgi:uncharacterized repeat protein (TIGR01451 family)
MNKNLRGLTYILFFCFSVASIGAQSADLLINQFNVNDNTPDEGQSITFTIKVKNNGPNSATNVAVESVIPAGYSYVSSTASAGSYDSGTGVWTIGTLTSGTTRQLTINVTVGAGTSGNNINSVVSILASDQTDPISTNNSSNIDVVVNSANLELTKTVNDNTPDEGQTVQFTLKVKNNGPSFANSIIVNDLLPAGLTYVSDDSGGAYNSVTGDWNVGNLVFNAQSQIKIDATVDAGTAAQTITNEFTLVSFDQYDNDALDNESSVDLFVNGADLEVTKTVNNTNPAVGNTITYTIVVTNNGPLKANNITIQDILPATLTYQSSTISQGTPYNSGTGQWFVNDLNAGASATLTIDATVNVTANGTLVTNTASVLSVIEDDSITDNNSDSVDIGVGSADLQITKNVDAPTKAVGDTVTYTIQAINNSVTTNVFQTIITDLLPEHVTYVGDDSASSGTTYDPATGIWDAGTINALTSKTLTIICTVNSGTGGLVITNTASGSSIMQDGDTSNNTDSADFQVLGADLAITKTVNDPFPSVDDIIQYTVTITNNGPVNATGINVLDQLPFSLDWVSHVASQGAYNNISGVWNVGALNNGNSATLTIDAQVILSGAFINVASLTSSSQSDGVTNNNTASAKVSAKRTFEAGSAIIDMGVSTQTYNSGLIPFGLVYELAINNLIPIYWVVNHTKSWEDANAKVDQVDITVNGKDYKGGPFVIPVEYMGIAEPIINQWMTDYPGLVVDKNLPEFESLYYDYISSFPRAVLDTQNGDKVQDAFYDRANVPITFGRIGDPDDLTLCDDMYTMPHADPQNWSASTVNTLIDFIENGGYFWSACHAVSAMEGLVDTDNDGNPDLNLLSNNGLIPWGDHDNGTPPYSYNIQTGVFNGSETAGDPLMQFLGTMDGALQNGSEQIYIPDVDGWRDSTVLALTDDDHPEVIDGTYPTGPATALAYGRAFGDNSNGMVMYEGSHSIAGGTEAENVAAARVYGNFLLQAGIERRPKLKIDPIASLLYTQESYAMVAEVSGIAPPFTFQWIDSCGGTFDDPTSATPNYTPNPTITGPDKCLIRVIVTDNCGRRNFTSFKVVIVDDLDEDNDGILDSIECTDLGKAPLLNSDFEDLDITAGLDGGPTDVVASTGIWKGDASNIPHWLSSDTANNHLEVWHNTQGAASDLGGRAYSGSQWGEVNATTNDGLYQDITTTPGDVLQWSFAHRKRTSYAGSTGEDIVRLLIGDPSGTMSSQGNFSSAGDASWSVHSGTYTVPAGQTTTRLTFTAIAVASGGGTTSGNFIDKVQLYVLPNCEDTDGDGVADYLDIDSDNDGIPDNVEGQTTTGYIGPAYTYSLYGVDDNYPAGIVPVDTDTDGIPDYRDTDSDSDSIPDIQENGMANVTSGTDTDGDGLDDVFETNGVNDASLDVNEDIEAPTDLSVLPDVDGDLSTGGDLDYRDLFDGNPPSSATLDFDGVDDYLTGESMLQSLQEVTIMAWIKITTISGVTDRTIAGEDVSCRIYRKHGNMPSFGMRLSSGVTNVLSGSSVNVGEWHHVAGKFDNTTGTQTLYIDGELISTVTNAAWIGETIEADSSLWNGKFEVGRLSRTGSSIQHFSGSIDEVRVFDVALTDSQIQQIVYQEIQDNSGNVAGKIVPKDVKDTASGNTILWSHLIGYYPMTDIKTGVTLDGSLSNKPLTLRNITTVQDQTAPMPYMTANDGSWSSESTWLHGDVWDIENTSTNKDWSILKIANDVTVCHDFGSYGLIIDSGSTLTVHSDRLVENDWYLELNGTLDLEDDSQLVQTITSDLVTSATGKILRRQEGTSSPFRYNYWGSPVGALGATSLTDNNAATNNTNNSSYTLNMLKDEAKNNILFTSNYTANGNISTYWLYTYINGLTYWHWEFLSPNDPLIPGVGYTQKGTGIGDSEQQYIFEGKPNNGTILIDVLDKGGPGSVANASKTEFLFGNPYPSAIDIHKFIDDNAGVIDGTLQLWQQWGGNSHNLSEYEGGYAQVNKTGSTRAYQFVGFYGDHNGSQDGTIVPTRYLPVGQGFITEIVADGQVEFNNSQRVFIKETDADGTYLNGSVFSKDANSKTKSESKSNKKDKIDLMQRMRLELNSIKGPKTRRELLLGFSESTTDGYDYGYDALSADSSNNDLNLSLEGKNMNIMAYSPITSDKTIPLNFKSSGDNSFNIKITELENIDETQAIYLKDNLAGVYFDLTQKSGYSFTSAQGVFNKRFEIVFQKEGQVLGIDESIVEDSNIYFQNATNTLFVKKLNSTVSKLSLVNMRGQTVLEMLNVSTEQLNNGIQFSNISTGAYVVCMRTEANEVLTKKVIVN